MPHNIKPEAKGGRTSEHTHHAASRERSSVLSIMGGGDCNAPTSNTSQCGSRSSHRSRTPCRILTSSETQTITLDATIHKNYHIDLLHSQSKISLTNVASGRRGHIVVSNRLSEAGTVEFTNTDLISNMPGPYTVPGDGHVVIRYYSDLNLLIAEVMVAV